MDLQQIKYFLALADELHFWNTAGKMNITQSALSRQIQALESDLGVQLFNRTKRSVKLTPAGAFLKEKWGRELSEINYIHQFAKQIHLGEQGTIRIAHPDSISGSLMPDIVARITSTFPKLQLELVQVLYESQKEFLSNYKLDLVITRDENQMKEIRSEKYAIDNLALVVPENHPFQTFEDLSKDKLIDQKFILPVKDESSSYNHIIQQMFETLDIIPNVYLHSEFGSTIIALVKKGLGIAVLPDSYRYHEMPGVRFIPLPFQTELYLNWRSDDNNPVLVNILRLILGKAI
ncbi:LysR family transcriptional regulator [Pedobacter sp. Hv1]|uniref:LysR family transcriptional regulator n=1 Tax=Pedobacter sp. Hv1 TaxID=1740090 RepID=UPI0006D89203|nr:LysR family transcriptional regulator [Pedobacter sp. Hv1]KQB98632.1 LysR family transcriptional regulator [Pedobacter sp. Hv1]